MNTHVMRIAIAVVLTTAMCTLPACPPEGESPSPAENQPAVAPGVQDFADYWPMAVGNEWHFELNNKIVRIDKVIGDLSNDHTNAWAVQILIYDLDGEVTTDLTLAYVFREDFVVQAPLDRVDEVMNDRNHPLNDVHRIAPRYFDYGQPIQEFKSCRECIPYQKYIMAGPLRDVHDVFPCENEGEIHHYAIPAPADHPTAVLTEEMFCGDFDAGFVSQPGHEQYFGYGIGPLAYQGWNRWSTTLFLDHAVIDGELYVPGF
jgi:hypothetical protein